MNNLTEDEDKAINTQLRAHILLDMVDAQSCLQCALDEMVQFDLGEGFAKALLSDVARRCDSDEELAGELLREDGDEEGLVLSGEAVKERIQRQAADVRAFKQRFGL
ncbi:hypothetical protein HK097_011446 [Rhizophlyctis rosea]|uniref:Uncharacterized protein n=1 Tax=Rhizophlyctis rosea TaxID=64517 RepID=A0AAD5WZW8_9FUNG|nr:hypothetical protein HK097_011446 [Rhizophlyctis rosea]